MRSTQLLNAEADLRLGGVASHRRSRAQQSLEGLGGKTEGLRQVEQQCQVLQTGLADRLTLLRYLQSRAAQRLGDEVRIAAEGLGDADDPHDPRLVRIRWPPTCVRKSITCDFTVVPVIHRGGHQKQQHTVRQADGLPASFTARDPALLTDG